MGANRAGSSAYHPGMSDSRALVLTDGRAGNRAQAHALADAMGLEIVEPTLALPAPWRWFAPRALPGGDRWLPALPDGTAIAIGCGRLGAWATARLHGRVPTVQVLDPRLDPRRWDVVVAPRHDGLAGDNVVTTLGSLNAIAPARLAAAALASPEHAIDATPRWAVLVGGTTRAQRIDAAYVDSLVARLRELHAREGGGFLVTTSRRTGADAVAALRRGFAGLPARLWTGDADGPNPYLAFLAHAQRIVVTPDSVNLASEACATGKPVYVHAAQPIAGKLAQFHAALVAGGHARALDAFDAGWRSVPLRETQAVAAEVGRRIRGKQRLPSPANAGEG